MNEKMHRYIESRPTPVSNFDYFAVDTSDGNLTLNGHTVPLGQVTCEILNIPKDFYTELLYIGADMMNAGKAAAQGEYDNAKYQAVRMQLNRVMDFVGNTAPFSYFNVEDSHRIVNDLYSDESLAEYAKILNPTGILPMGESARLHKKYETCEYLLKVYFYLINDIVNYATMALNFAEVLTVNDFRTKQDLARAALSFFTDDEYLSQMEASEPCPNIPGVTLRPRASVIPAVPWDRTKESLSALQIKRRVYYGRLMDFFVSELFDGLAAGHYVRRCKMCDRYFLVTDAHKQYYCQTFNPKYGTTCANAAKHRKTRIAKDGLEKQKTADSPLYRLYHKRYDSIRKDKSTGKYPPEICNAAAKLAREHYERAVIESEYAEGQYETDMILAGIYESVK